MVVAALMGLANEGKIEMSVAAQAAKDLHISDPTEPNPNGDADE